MNDNLEFKVRILALKKAAIVMGALAKQMKEHHVQSETESLAWTISWAVKELEERHALDRK